MTIPQTSIYKKVYAGTGSTGPFPIVIPIQDANQVEVVRVVSLTGIETILTKDALTDGYTVSSDLNNVTTTEAVVSGEKLVVKLGVPLSQGLDLRENQAFPAENAEAAWDKALLIDIQQQEEIDRCLKISVASEGVGITFPDPTGNVGKYLKVNPTEDGMEFTDLSDVSAIELSPFAGTLLDDTSAEEARETLGIVVGVTGAAGDGVTDDSAAILSAINAAAGGILDGGGLTYRIDSPIAPTAENIVIQNMTLDMSNVPDQAGSPDHVITFSGTQGTSSALTSDVAIGDYVINVADTSNFIADGEAFISSDALWYDESLTGAGGSSCSLGQMVLIKSVDSGTQITLYEALSFPFNTADNAEIAPLTLRENFTFDNVKVIGSDNNLQNAFLFNKCKNVHIQNCKTEYLPYGAFTFTRCRDCLVTHSTIDHATTAGFAYGVVVANGCLNVNMTFCNGLQARHLFTIGGSNGVNVACDALFNTVNGADDAGIDAHVASHRCRFEGNAVTLDPTANNAVGIAYQGTDPIIRNNTLVNSSATGVLFQSFVTLPSFESSAILDGNHITGSGTGSTDIGVYVDKGYPKLINVSACGNTVNGPFEIGVYVNAPNNDKENFKIDGNTINGATDFGVQVRAGATYTLNSLSVGSNIIKGSGTGGVQVSGDDAATLTNVTVSGNIIEGFAHGIKAFFGVGGRFHNNTITNYSSDPYEIHSSFTAVKVDGSGFGNPQTITNSAFTMEEDDTHLICNRGSAVTITMFDATRMKGHEVTIKTVQAFAVDSASSNIVPIDDTVAGTSILPATDGAWVKLMSDGTNWVVMSQG